MQEIITPRKPNPFPEMWPEAKFSVAGFCTKDKLIMDLVKISEQLFYNIPIKNVYGCPNVILNSGRAMSRKGIGVKIIETLVHFYNSRNIGIFLTLSNYFVKEYMLHDKSINFLLRTISKNSGHINGVIISNDTLNNYIKEKYPNLKRKPSILKVVEENGKGNIEYYQKLLKEYDSIILHPDDIFNLVILNKLVNYKSRIEILINENCLFGCTNRLDHYEIISALQINSNNLIVQDECSEFFYKRCQSFSMEKQLNKTERNLNITQQEFKTIYDLGYRNFKIQGRTDEDHQFLYDCTRFLFNEVYSTLIFKLMCNSKIYGIQTLGKRNQK